MSKSRKILLVVVLSVITLLTILAAIVYLSREQLLAKSSGLERKQEFNEEEYGERISSMKDNRDEKPQNSTTSNKPNGQSSDSNEVGTNLPIPSNLTCNWIYYPDPEQDSGISMSTPISSDYLRSLVGYEASYELQMESQVIQDIVYQSLAGQPGVSDYMDDLEVSTHEGYISLSFDLAREISRPTGIDILQLILVQSDTGNLQIDRVVLDGYEYELVPDGYFDLITSDIVLGINRSLSSIEIEMDGSAYKVGSLEFHEGYFSAIATSSNPASN